MAYITGICILYIVMLQCSELRSYYLYGRDVGTSGHPYHRSWTPWSSWSHCSRTCGGGITMRTRLCRRRIVGNWMKQSGSCPGETTEYKTCNTEKCSKDAMDFRIFQCSLYNNRLVSKHHVTDWIPYEKGENKCELRCQERNSSRPYSFGKVFDGTECSSKPGDRNVCVNGRCLVVGCDNKIGSDARLDLCGVCGGRNDTCVYYRNVYLGQPMEPGYQEIAIIPAGSTHVEIRDLSYANQLALMDSEYQYVINGPGMSSYPGEYSITGNVVHYSGPTENKETISASGPTNQQLHVVAFLRDRNPGIYYEYWVPKDNYRYITSAKSNVIFSNDNVKQKSTARKEKPGVIEREMNPLNYHNYRLGSLRDKGSDVSVKFVDKSGHRVPLKNRYTSTDVPSKTKCINCPAQSSSGRKKGRYNGTAGSCQVCKKVKNLPRHFCISDFVVRGIITKREKIQGKLRYELQVIESFRNNIAMQSREYIWTRGKCRCPKLRVNKEYILMGYSDHARRENRLLIDRNCYARRYRNKKYFQLLQMKRNGCANIT